MTALDVRWLSLFADVPAPSFCLADDEGRPRRCRPPAAWPGGRSRVDQQCIDVPAADFEPECDFWARLTG